MTNIKKIRQEIERLKKWSESSKKEWIDEGYKQNAFAEDCRIKSFDKLLAFIDSLPDEQLTWQDIKKIVNIADGLLDDPRMRIAIQNHSEEEYYQKVLDEYSRLHQATEG